MVQDNDKDYVYCRYCGKKIDKDAIFCIYCGKQQIEVSNETKKYISSAAQISHNILAVILSFIKLILYPFKKIGQIRFTKTEKDRAIRIVRRIAKISVAIIILCALVGGALAGYFYYNQEYLPKKYEQDAYNDIVYKFNNSDDSIKLDLAIKICRPYYSWENEYPLVQPGRIPVLLRFQDTDTEDGYCGKAYDFIFSQAKDGNAKAQYHLAKVLLGGENSIWLSDTTRAVYWFNEAAKNGYSKAFGEIGTAYEKGIGTTQNLTKAVKIFEEGAELDDPKSQYKLGCMYRDGIKIGNGWHWETKSTTNYIYGDNVIKEYYDGQKGMFVYVYREKTMDSLILVPQDLDRAKYLWRKAARNGSVDAAKCLQQVYEE